MERKESTTLRPMRFCAATKAHAGRQRTLAASAERMPDGHPALTRLHRWIQANNPLQLTLHQAAKLACLEPHYFSAVFRKHVGVTFIGWRRTLRIEHAVKLIESRCPIDDVVRMVGYSCRRSLERAIKGLLGVTPGSLQRGAEEARTTRR